MKNKLREKSVREHIEAIIGFMEREDGPTAVEYAVMIGIIVVACIAAIAFVGTGASSIFTGAGAGAGPTP
jgi:pilus assembly protein Flp/PilA